jgi:Ca2+/Na+ antiporter
MVWIYITSNMVVDSLNIIGLALEISPTWLGLTFLSWGNSWEDTSANQEMTR